MTTNTKAPIVYTDLEPAKNENGPELAEGQVSGKDPRLTKFWYDAAILAQENSFCGQYDIMARKLGGPSRAELGVRDISRGNNRYGGVPTRTSKGETRTNQKIVFRAKVDIMGEQKEVTWSPTLRTTGTREDINYVLQYEHSKPPHAVIQAKLKAARSKLLKAAIEAQSGGDIVF